MRYNILIIFITIILSYGCSKNQLNIIKNGDINWKNIATEELVKQYVIYKKNNYRPNDSCYQSTLDLYYKIVDLNRYPFEQGILLLKKEIISKKIKFDSIVCVSTQVIGFDPEILTGNMYYVFYKEEIKSSFYHDYLNDKIEASDPKEFNMKEEYDRLIKKMDGDDMTLLIFTKFDQKWNYSISKFVINTHDVW